MTTYSFIDESGETRLVGTISPAPGGGSQPGAPVVTGPYKFNAFTAQTCIPDQSTATGGTFTFTYNGNTTAAIPWNASSAAVHAALAALSSMAGITFTVEQYPGDEDGINSEYYVTILSPLVTHALSGSLANVTGPDAPYTATIGRNTVTDGHLPVATLAPGDMLIDLIHEVKTAWDGTPKLSYSDDFRNPGGAVPIWNAPFGPTTSGSKLDHADELTNLSGGSTTGAVYAPSERTREALIATGTAYALPAVALNAVTVYAFVSNQNVGTNGEVWIWTVIATPVEP